MAEQEEISCQIVGIQSGSNIKCFHFVGGSLFSLWSSALEADERFEFVNFSLDLVYFHSEGKAKIHQIKPFRAKLSQ